uniref:Uncharacterized protein n=1 Tax=Glossina austeni TaxID=7395 RepID=A0A1A9V4I1_GLOAU
MVIFRKKVQFAGEIRTALIHRRICIRLGDVTLNVVIYLILFVPLASIRILALPKKAVNFKTKSDYNNVKY